MDTFTSIDHVGYYQAIIGLPSNWRKTGLAILLAGTTSSAVAADPIAFVNIATDPAMQLHFERARSTAYSDLIDFYQQSLINPVSIESVLSGSPHRTGGFPGIALLDHDGDGDTDIYVTNGPDASNGFFENQLMDSGELGFRNISIQSGADAFTQDSNGVCFGDLDNDGDDDLYVLGREEENHLYENFGGTFLLLESHGAEGGQLSHISCSMGDIDADGMLDIAVANVFDLTNLLPLAAVPYELNHHNQLFRNLGGLQFEDVSETSGILNMVLGGTDDPQPPTISWAVSMVDIDLDGDVDLVFGDDQAGLPNAGRGGFDRGYLQIFLNDGNGYFTNTPIALNENSSSAWMGMGFGDLDCNGSIDIFASNLGSYAFEANGIPSNIDAEATRWLLGNGDGSFIDPGAASASAFGWGNGVADFDNDGDQDIVYHGAMDLNASITHDNPGIVLENHDCTATFSENLQAFSADYITRGTQGVATADLDKDGYVDVVTVSNHRVDSQIPFFISPAQYGSALDATARFYLPMLPNPNTGLLQWGGVETLPGDLTVEINQGSTSRSQPGAVWVRVQGSIGTVKHAQVNRSGIGAVLSFTPHDMPTVTQPIVAGSSFTSQHALEAHFGMGHTHHGTLEVQWPGGVRNRLYYVRSGEQLVLPEIPCSIDSDMGWYRYRNCVTKSLRQLQQAKVVDRRESRRLKFSAMLAFLREKSDH